MASDQTAPEATSATTTTTPAAAGDYSNGKGSSSTTSAAHPQRRRIIKAAAPPKVVNGDNYSTQSSPKNGIAVEDDDDALEGSNRGGGKHLSKKQHDPLVLIEDAKETAESWREERLSRAQNRGKALREKELAERRKLAVNQNANLSANPFSRFLSVFSVESKHPEHKRSLEVTGDYNSASVEDLDLIKGPVEKRRKQSVDDEDSYNVDGGNKAANNNESSSSSWDLVMSSKWIWLSTAAALVVGVAVALQRGRKK